MKNFLLTVLLMISAIPAFAKDTIVIIGDSISAGYGINLSESWAHLLQQKLQDQGYAYQVINDSISGDTTSNGLARLPKLLSEYKPQVTLIELGANDGLRGISLITIKNNLRQMIELVQQQGGKVLLLGIRLPPNYGPEYTQQFHQIYVDLADEKEVSLVPFILQGVDEDKKLLQQDGLHPVAEAQPIILENIWPKLTPLLNKD